MWDTHSLSLYSDEINNFCKSVTCCSCDCSKWCVSSCSGLLCCLCAEAALRKSEMQKSEMDTELARLRDVEANLKDALVKMRSINDSLALDRDEQAASLAKVR